MLVDVIYYCKIMSVMALDGVMSFLRLKDVTNTSKRMQHSPTTCGNSSVQWRMFEEADSIYVFVVCCVLKSKKISSSE